MQSPIGSHKLNLYLLAGVATAPTFMAELGSTFQQELEAMGIPVSVELLFPYGDWHTPVSLQLREIRRDLLPIASRGWSSIGGRRMADQIAAHDEGGSIWIVGHSAGGVAAVHAGDLLVREMGLPIERIVQIGSPRCRIPATLQHVTTMYIYSVNGKGSRKDPITRLGSWSGWERTQRGLPHRNATKYAPKVIVPLALTGGHPDYFRSHPPYVDQNGISNLEHMLAILLKLY